MEPDASQSGMKIWPICLAAQGGTLCASQTSARGAGVCVWCLKTGQLPYTLDNNCQDGPIAQGELGDGNDAQPLTLLEDGHTLLLTSLEGRGLLLTEC